MSQPLLDLRTHPPRADQICVTPTLPFTAPRPVELFAVDDRSAQITWRGLGDGCVIARVDDRIVPLGEGVRPGAALVPDLMPDRDHTIVVSLDDRPVDTLRVRTAPCLGVNATVRVATISDLHLGEPGFGLVKRMNEPRDIPEAYPLRCATAAIEEATEWGADLIVIKGDITEASRSEEWEEFDRLLDRVDRPLLAIPGNHDVVGRRHSLDGAHELEKRGLFPSAVQTADLGAVRLVLADSTVPGRSFGRLAPVADELVDAVSVDRPVLLLTHHHLQATAVPWFWPVGTTRHDGYGTLDRVVDANPDVFLSSGHTHRNRARRHRTAVVSEVGSPKDHPGVWAGYELAPEGIRQTLRRVSRPDCIEWTERTRAIVGGVWGCWAPGRLADRCVTHLWSRRTEEAGSRRAQDVLGS